MTAQPDYKIRSGGALAPEQCAWNNQSEPAPKAIYSARFLTKL